MRIIRKQKISVLLRSDSGGVAAVTGLLMTVFLGFLAFAIDIGHLTLVKSELQRAADAGALAGARGLYPDNLTTLPVGYTPGTQDPSNTSFNSFTNAINRASAEALANLTDGSPPTITYNQPGVWNLQNKTFTANQSPATNALKISVQHANVTMFFAGILGFGPQNLEATSIALMAPVGGLPTGTIPVAIGKNWAMSNQIETLQFSNDNIDNGSWFAPNPQNVNAAIVDTYINNDNMPPIYIGESLNLLNGNATSALQDLAAELVNNHGGSWVGNDHSTGSWDVRLPVVDTTQFNQSQPVLGFLDFRITEIDAHGNPKTIKGIPKPAQIDPNPTLTPTGQGVYGLLAPPRLVQ
jgi:hypothetical protein